MSQSHGIRQNSILVLLLCVLILGAAVCVNAQAVPATQHSSIKAKAKTRAQLKEVEAKIAAARTHQDALRVQLEKLERENAAQHKQLQRRDAEITALQRKLTAAGVPAASASAGH